MDIASLVRTSFVRLDEESTVSDFIGQLTTTSTKYGFVFSGKTYKGVVAVRSLLRSQLDASQTKVKAFLHPTSMVKKVMSSDEAVSLLLGSNVTELPVEENGNVIGIIRAVDVLQALLRQQEFSNLKVDDTTVIAPTKVQENDALTKVLQVMHDESVAHVPLFAGEKLSGIVSAHDIVQKYLASPPQRTFSKRLSTFFGSRSAKPNTSSYPSQPASNVSTSEIVSVEGTDLLSKAVQLMIQKNISDVVVMRKGAYAGVLPLKSILVRLQPQEVSHLQVFFVGLNKVTLKPFELQALQTIAQTEAEKLQQGVHNECKVNIHVKEYDKDGKRRKYSINLRLEFPGRVISAADDDWTAEAALHKAFQNARNEIKKQFKGDSGMDRHYKREDKKEITKRRKKK